MEVDGCSRESESENERVRERVGEGEKSEKSGRERALGLREREGGAWSTGALLCEPSRADTRLHRGLHLVTKKPERNISFSRADTRLQRCLHLVTQ